MNNNHVFMKSDMVFEQNGFTKPDVAYAPVYTWIWHAKISREETKKQLDEMLRLGIRAMYILPEPKSFRPCTIPTLLEPDYLTAPYFEEFLYATREAEKLGMSIWLYDEGGWPSGGACGKVLLGYPEYAKRSLASRENIVKAGTTYKRPSDAVAAFRENGESIENGYYFKTDDRVTEYYSKVLLFEKPGFPDYPDLTRKEATEAFIQIGLETYKPYLSEFFGKGITAVFTDEPSMPRPVPFREELIEEFERRNGYSVLPYLPELFGEKVVNEEAAFARIAWYDMCSELFCQNFLLTEKEWVNQNGMSYTGHMDGDDRPMGWLLAGNYHVLRAHRCFDVPGVDVIWRQIFPAEQPTEYRLGAGIQGENRLFPRYASSAAAQIGSQRAMTESCGVYGAGETFEEMRYILNFQAVRGINVFNLFAVPYGREGFLMTGELPFFTEKHACYADLPTFNQYLERLSYVASLGTSANTTALYMPMWDLWAGEAAQSYADSFEKIGKDLEDDRILFDIFDDDVLELADAEALSCGEIRMGNARYTTVVIPPCKYMPRLTVEKLEHFIQSGGKVFMISCDNMPDIEGASVVENIKGCLKSPIVISGETRLLRVAERKMDNGRIYFIHNERVTTAEFGVNFVVKQSEMHEKDNIYLLDLNSGKVRLPHWENGEIQLSLASGEMAVLLCTEEVLSAEPICVYNSEKELREIFTFRRTRKFTVGEKTYISEEISEKEQIVELGDWSDIVGIDFSGSGIYKTIFSVPATKGIVCLDLGEVHYTCEVFLNGRSLGVCVMPPFRYEIPVEWLQEENVLELRISNTPANAYTYTTSFDKWQDWQLTPYWPKEKLYQLDSLSGGLYGPVRILYED